MKKDDDDTDQEISKNKSEDHGWCTLSFEIKKDDLDKQQELLQVDQAHHNKAIRTTRDPLPNKWSCAGTVIACTSLRNL
jgi:predicted hydrolase (HD superfamily)